MCGNIMHIKCKDKPWGHNTYKADDATTILHIQMMKNKTRAQFVFKHDFRIKCLEFTHKLDSLCSKYLGTSSCNSNVWRF